MRLNREEILTCNKCGHVFDECKKDIFVFCPNCKNIKRVDINGLDG